MAFNLIMQFQLYNYRNPFLATAMVNLNMIDTVGSGILKMFLAQKKRCFPLPDYDFSNHKVRMKLYGKILDINYTRRLLNEDLPLSEVFELDRKQKEEFISHRTDLVKKQEGEQVHNEGSEKSSQKNEKSRQKIVSLIAENPNITTFEMANKLNMSRSGITKQIAILQEQNIIRRVGPDKGGHWEVIEK